MKHKGCSGFAVQRKNDRVIKWTQGADSSPRLEASCFKQIDDYCNPHMKGILAVEVLRFDKGVNSFSFEMEYLDLESVYTHRGNFSMINTVLLNHFDELHPYYESGFQSIMMAEIDRLCDRHPFIRTYSQQIENQIEDVQYRYGYCHGDMGFANLLVDKHCLRAIDYSPSFIDSPLYDAAMMQMSFKMNAFKCLPEHAQIMKNVKNSFHDYEKIQIDLIEKVKILSFLPHAGSDDKFKEFMRIMNDDFE